MSVLPALPSGFGRFTTIFQDHRELAGTQVKLRHMCAVLLGDTWEDAPADPTQLLREFYADLTAHFEREETDEYFGVVASERPGLIPRLAELRAEHTELLETVSDLARQAQGALDRYDLARETLMVLARLRAHEQTETQLLNEFFEPES
ncbi:MAG: hemerythrin domain-containing protein [Myxococcota bacterium]